MRRRHRPCPARDRPSGLRGYGGGRDQSESPCPHDRGLTYIAHRTHKHTCTVCNYLRTRVKAREAFFLYLPGGPSQAERGRWLVTRKVGRAAAGPSAQAVGWLQRPRRSRAVENEQARWPPRKARLLRGALAGGGSSVVVGRGVACEAPSARRAGGIEWTQNSSDPLGRGPAATGGKVCWRIRRARLLRHTDRTAPHPLG